MNKVKRKAAGHFCLGLFAICNTLAHQLRTIADTRGTGLGEGLTEKEREFVSKKAKLFHDQSNVLKKLGWRLLDWQ